VQLAFGGTVQDMLTVTVRGEPESTVVDAGAIVIVGVSTWKYVTLTVAVVLAAA
jgi:hypothetical protein